MPASMSVSRLVLDIIQGVSLDPSFVFVFTCDHILPKKVGPVLGALLYKAAGFCLPFALTGTAILLSGFQVLVVTKMPSMASSNSSTSPQSSSSLAILSKPTVLIGLATATAGAYSIGTVEATVLFLSFSKPQNIFTYRQPSPPSSPPAWTCRSPRSPWPSSSCPSAPSLPPLSLDGCATQR